MSRNTETNRQVCGADLTSRRQVFENRVTELDRSCEGYAKAWAQLRSVLLNLGGVEVVPPLEHELLLVALLTDGRPDDAERIVRCPGKPSMCHSNIESLLADGWRHDAETLTTWRRGYALSDDGLWRSHSWGVLTNGTLVETTEEREQYFGVAVDTSHPATL